jgi:hypothetical protein
VEPAAVSGRRAGKAGNVVASALCRIIGGSRLRTDCNLSTPGGTAVAAAAKHGFIETFNHVLVSTYLSIKP